MEARLRHRAEVAQRRGDGSDVVGRREKQRHELRDRVVVVQPSQNHGQRDPVGRVTVLAATAQPTARGGCKRCRGRRAAKLLVESPLAMDTKPRESARRGAHQVAVAAHEERHERKRRRQMGGMPQGFGGLCGVARLAQQSHQGRDGARVGRAPEGGYRRKYAEEISALDGDNQRLDGAGAPDAAQRLRGGSGDVAVLAHHEPRQARHGARALASTQDLGRVTENRCLRLAFADQAEDRLVRVAVRCRERLHGAGEPPFVAAIADELRAEQLDGGADARKTHHDGATHRPARLREELDQLLHGAPSCKARDLLDPRPVDGAQARGHGRALEGVRLPSPAAALKAARAVLLLCDVCAAIARTSSAMAPARFFSFVA